MSKAKQPKKYLYDITPASALIELDTSLLFHKGYVESKLSPIDQFFENTTKINVILGAKQGDIPESLSSLIILGYMSAVEGYLRALFRGIINIDEVAKRESEDKTIPFAAALHHDLDLLPEALLESTSFTSQKNLKDCMGELLGIKNIQDRAFEKAMEEFSKVVEIRHCCVHRFGKLGSKNAVKLGLIDHSKLLEKPFKPSMENLNHIFATLCGIVQTINSFIFKRLMERIVEQDKLKAYSFKFVWVSAQDKKYFKPYYDLFSSKKSATPSMSLALAYEELKGVHVNSS